MSRSIYVVKSEPGPVKIGIANKPRARFHNLRTASAVPLSLEYIGECVDDHAVAKIEATAHEILRDQHQRGEWFSTSVEDAVDAVILAAEQLGYELIPIATEIARGDPKDTMISARVPAAIKQAAERAAADDRRSLASLVEVALVEYLRPKGYLGAEKKRRP